VIHILTVLELWDNYGVMYKVHQRTQLHADQLKIQLPQSLELCRSSIVEPLPKG